MGLDRQCRTEMTIPLSPSLVLYSLGMCSPRFRLDLPISIFHLSRKDRLTAPTSPSSPFPDIPLLFNCRICATIITEKTTTKNKPAMVQPTIRPTLFPLVLLVCQLWICLVDVHDLRDWLGGYYYAEEGGGIVKGPWGCSLETSVSVQRTYRCHQYQEPRGWMWIWLPILLSTSMLIWWEMINGIQRHRTKSFEWAWTWLSLANKCPLGIKIMCVEESER